MRFYYLCFHSMNKYCFSLYVYLFFIVFLFIFYLKSILYIILEYWISNYLVEWWYKLLKLVVKLFKGLNIILHIGQKIVLFWKIRRKMINPMQNVAQYFELDLIDSSFVCYSDECIVNFTSTYHICPHNEWFYNLQTWIVVRWFYLHERNWNCMMQQFVS